ncbi:antibiotic biosynthesis monooxygenase [Yinghuangia seranimata]|uniref:antibiotic biosynthesis monooxygenase n=1 Tax=Yinghuangia seranimata TaxID=408067 RepID=UPI00248B16C0|nr:antibiotic biosynthesis monooxygenase [Yinghuangia seranimata]MDI2129145.1 antibiotic biosynthesis monooxygenase [Yinghuangia seranimata]
MQEPMYVRTTYVTGDPAQLGAALDALSREAPDLLRAQAGFRRFGLFADREVGKLLMGSWWESESARAESDKMLRERRMELLQPFATTVTTEAWEAVSFTPQPQVGPGGWLRTGRVEFAPSDAALYVSTFNEMGRPGLEAIDGLVGATLFMNGSAGRGMVGTLFRDKASMIASRGPQAAVRGEGLKKANVTLLSIEEFELVTMARADG